MVVAAFMAIAITNAFGVLSGSPSNFESGDGNMIVDTTGNNDWASVQSNADYVHVTDKSNSTADDSFTSGQKQDTTCPDVSGHKNPPKDDFTDVASFDETNGDNHTFLYGATIRYAANGNASENVELKQSDSQCTGSDLNVRTAGDKLIAIDYLSGGTKVNFHVLTWIEDSSGFDPTPNVTPADDIAGTCFVGSDSPPCWSSTVQTLSANAAEGLASQSDIAAGDNPISGKALVAGQFAEFGIDLSAAGIIPANSCEGFAQTVWESRASGSSFVSTTKDIAIENHSISNCAQLTVIKQTDPRGIDQKFSFTSDLPDTDSGGVECTSGGGAGIQSGAFCLNDSGNSGDVGSTNAADNSTENTVTETDLLPGDYNVTEGDNPTGFSFDSVTCTGGGANAVTQDPNNSKHVTISLAANDNVVCVYVNNQQLGAIQITKTSKKSSSATLAGAHFQVCNNDGPYDANSNPCDVVTGGSDLVTGDDGTVCLDGLTFGDYYVSETSPPDHYAVDDTSAHKVTVDNNAGCADTTFGGETISFTDTPLTDVVISATSEDSGAGGSHSAIQCVDSSSADIGDSPQPAGVDLSDTSTYDDPVTVTANGLAPGTYTCTVKIDP
jgi:hypothetical protein